MCRWLAYSGEPLKTSIVILDAQHSLVAQSLNSPLGKETVNGDGFGFGWYPSGSTKGSKPSLFHSIEPAWNDTNLRRAVMDWHGAEAACPYKVPLTKLMPRVRERLA